MSLEKIGERVGRLEIITQNHEQRLQKQESNSELLIEMRTVIKSQMELNKQHSEQMKEFSNTLININENLSKLNHSQDQLRKDMNKIGQRVSHIEESQNKRKIDPMEVIRYVIWTVLTGATVWFIYSQLGIN